MVRMQKPHAVSKAEKVYLLNKNEIKLYKNALPTKTQHNKTNVTQHDLNGKHVIPPPPKDRLAQLI